MNYFYRFLHYLCVIFGLIVVFHFGCTGFFKADDTSTTSDQHSDSEAKQGEESTESEADAQGQDDSQTIVSQNGQGSGINASFPSETTELTVVDDYDRVFHNEEYIGNLLINRTDNRCDGVALISGETITMDELINRTDFADSNNIITRADLVGLSLYVEEKIFEDKMNNWELSDDVATNGSADATITMSFEEDSLTTMKYRQTQSIPNQTSGTLYCVYRTMAPDGNFSAIQGAVKVQLNASFLPECKITIKIHTVYDAHISLALFTDQLEASKGGYSNGYLGQLSFKTTMGTSLPWYAITQTKTEFLNLFLNSNGMFATNTTTNLHSLDTVENFQKFYDKDSDGVCDVFQSQSVLSFVYADTIKEETYKNARALRVSVSLSGELSNM